MEIGQSIFRFKNSPLPKDIKSPTFEKVNGKEYQRLEIK
jgi:hypothetical protein